MIRGIAEEVGQYCDLEVLTQSYFCDADKAVSTFTMKRKRWIDLVRSVSIRYIALAVRIAKNDRLSIRKTLKILYYCLGGAYAERQIKKLQPEKLFIHSINYYTIPFLFAASRAKVGTVVTLHGLISLDRDVVDVGDSVAEAEIKVIEECPDAGYGLTMIASGMKRRAERAFNIDLSKVHVLSNFCDSSIEFAATSVEVSQLRRMHPRSILCVGSVYKLKNQMEVIKAFEQLAASSQPDIMLRIIGDGPDLPMLKRYVIEHSVNNIVFLGRLSREDVIEEYKQSSLVVVASLTEGFGLPLLEGFWFGVPGVAFSDIDAFEDLYSKEAMIPVTSRSTEALAESIGRALSMKWDPEAIQSVARRFSRSVIGRRYFKVLSYAHGSLPESIFEKIWSS